MTSDGHVDALSGEGCDYRRIIAAAAASLEALLYRIGDLSVVDPWIERIDRLFDSHPEFSDSPEADRLSYLIFVALTLRRPDHPRIEQWKTRVYAVFDQHEDPNLRILCGFCLFANGHLSGHRGGMHHFWQILQQLASRPEVGPQARIAERLVTVWYQGLKGSVPESLKAFEAGLAVARDSNIDVWNGLLFVYAITGVLNEGDTETADALLARMEAILDDLSPLDRIYFHHLRGWNSLLEHDLGRAFFHQNRSLAGALKLGLQNRIAGTCHFGLAVILHEQGETAAARKHLNGCRAIGLRLENRDLVYLCDLTEAQIALESGFSEKAAEHLRAAMKAGRDLGFLKFTFWRAEVMTRLCCFALQEGIDEDFVAKMIRHFGLSPPTPSWRLANWPWTVQIRTLGGFTLLVEGKEVVFSTKAPKKSLELLKALIVLGPNPAEVMLADLLWPHADGDAAIRSLEITLHRLRKLLGDAALIRRTEGKLILDRKRIFVDVWALDALLEEVNAGAGGTEEELIACCRRLSTLHRGTYLHGENDLEWVLPIRQKLAQRYLQGIIALGCRCEARQLYHEAAALYQQAIEHQPRVEILYHRLISCHLETGRRPEALTLYKRYQMMLHSLGLTPNPATMTLVRSLLTT